MYGIPDISYRALSAYAGAQPVAAGNAPREIAPEPHAFNTPSRQLKQDKKGGGLGHRLSREPVERVDISREAMILLSRIRP